MSEGEVVRVTVESSCEGRQGQIFVAGDTLRIRLKIDRDGVLLLELRCFITE